MNAERVRERDRSLRRVRRITRTVAAVSVGVCAAVAGLAVGSKSVPLHTSGAKAATVTTSTASSTASDDTSTATITPAASAPVVSSAPAVATSGGS